MGKTYWLFLIILFLIMVIWRSTSLNYNISLRPIHTISKLYKKYRFRDHTIIWSSVYSFCLKLSEGTNSKNFLVRFFCPKIQYITSLANLYYVVREFSNCSNLFFIFDMETSIQKTKTHNYSSDHLIVCTRLY